MAELDEDDLDLKPADAGALFRAEMWATNAVLGYWKHLLAVLVVVLLSFLFYGQYKDYVQRTQRSFTSMTAEVESSLPDTFDVLGQQIATGSLEIEPSELESAGDKLIEVADQASGTARAEALLKAAELFRLAEADEKRREVLNKASEDAEGVLRFAAEGALANLELELEEGDAAVQRLKNMMQDTEGFLAEQAALDLGLALEQLDRNDEAIGVYDEFLTRWPSSPRVDEVRERRDRVSG